MTSTGCLKPCLCYDTGIELGRMLREGTPDAELLEAIRECILSKPEQHCFEKEDEISEKKLMAQIGG